MGPENTEPRGTYQPHRLMTSKPLKLNNVSRYRIGNAQAPDHDAATIFLKAASGVIFLRSNEPPEPRVRPQTASTTIPLNAGSRLSQFSPFVIAATRALLFFFCSLTRFCQRSRSLAVILRPG